MRVYFDHRQTIDLYGKINKGLVVQDTQFYPSEEQIQAGSGDDCLWVGNTYGLGALRGWDGKDQVLFNNVKYQEQRIISEGPLRAIVEVVDKGWIPAPGLQPVNATIRYTIYAGHRDFDVDVFFNKDVSDYQFATGLINVKGSSEFADGKGLRGCYGSDWPTGKDDGKHKLETVGLGIYVPQSALVSQQPANKDCYTQVVKLAGSQLSYKLAYTSANETYGFKGEKEWYEWLKAWKKQMGRSRFRFQFLSSSDKQFLLSSDKQKTAQIASNEQKKPYVLLIAGYFANKFKRKTHFFCECV